ncbi:hypothetical protein ABIF34_007296 [Bradyrhizobium japonicum]
MGAAEHLFGLRQIVLQHIGQAEIGQNLRLVRHDLQRGRVILLRLFVATELVERRALRRQDAPVRILRRMRAAQNVESLLEIAVVGERAAVAGEQRLVAGMAEHGLLEHRDRLGALPALAQRLAVVERDVGIAGLGAITLAQCVHVRLAVCLARGFRLAAERAGDVLDASGLTAAEGKEHKRGQQISRRARGKGQTLGHTLITRRLIRDAYRLTLNSR